MAAKSHFLKKLIGLYLPFGVVMLLQGAGVGSRQDDQAAVLPVHFLHGGPGADDPVCRPEREVVQVLMHWVTRRLFTWDNKNDRNAAVFLLFLWSISDNPGGGSSELYIISSGLTSAISLWWENFRIFFWLDTCIGRFVDQHRVHGHDVGSSETLHILEDLTKEGRYSGSNLFRSWSCFTKEIFNANVAYQVK